MNNMFTSVNAFFRMKYGDSTNVHRKALFSCSIDRAVSINGISGWGQLTAVYFTTFIFNTLELIKSKLGKRIPVYKKLCRYDVESNGTYFVNIINGTVVILDENDVFKFYFKDTGYFRGFYKRIGPSISVETSLGEDYFCIRQLRYNKLASRLTDSQMLIAIRPLIGKYQQFAYTQQIDEIKLTPRYKVLQIIKFYNQESNQKTVEYLALADKILEKSAAFSKVLCHGDLHKENIVEDYNGQLVLIDFDKTLFFCCSYDYVYFYLMNRVITSGVCAEKILYYSENHANDISNFLEYECSGLIGKYDMKEIDLGVLLFCLFKLVERDLFQKECSKSIDLLQKKVEAI